MCRSQAGTRLGSFSKIPRSFRTTFLGMGVVLLNPTIANKVQTGTSAFWARKSLSEREALVFVTYSFYETYSLCREGGRTPRGCPRRI